MVVGFIGMKAQGEDWWLQRGGVSMAGAGGEHKDDGVERKGRGVALWRCFVGEGGGRESSSGLV
jgi:hypothetical protein